MVYFTGQVIQGARCFSSCYTATINSGNDVETQEWLHIPILPHKVLVHPHQPHHGAGFGLLLERYYFPSSPVSEELDPTQSHEKPFIP